MMALWSSCGRCRNIHSRDFEFLNPDAAKKPRRRVPWRPVVVGALLMILVRDKMRYDEHQIYHTTILTSTTFQPLRM